MSELKVEICLIDNVESHPNADRLDLVTIKGWNCVVQKDVFKIGDKCLYIPIDSILPQEVEEVLFGPSSKIKLHHSRVKTIKLRGAISQGMAVIPELFDLKNYSIGYDAKKELGITKYEPPLRLGPQSNTNPTGKKQVNPNFHKYTSIENFKNYPLLFCENDIVCVTEKIHGTNFRCGWVEFHATTLWKKLQKFFGFAPKYEFVFGSHNVQLQDRLIDKNYYKEKTGQNVYIEAVKKYDLKNVLKPGEVIYGEIYGDGIQKNYSYGCKAGERKLVIFDFMYHGEFMPFDTVKSILGKDRCLPIVPEIYFGVYDVEKIKSFVSGDSILCPAQKIREGIVIKPIVETTSYMGRKILKLINAEYLLRDNTEFH